MSIKASPGEPADIEGNRVPCAYCDRVAFTRIGPFMTVGEVRERLSNGGAVGEPRCLRHLNGPGELSLAAQHEADGSANLREKTA